MIVGDSLKKLRRANAKRAQANGESVVADLGSAAMNGLKIALTKLAIAPVMMPSGPAGVSDMDAVSACLVVADGAALATVSTESSDIVPVNVVFAAVGAERLAAVEDGRPAAGAVTWVGLWLGVGTTFSPPGCLAAVSGFAVGDELSSATGVLTAVSGRSDGMVPAGGAGAAEVDGLASVELLDSSLGSTVFLGISSEEF